MPWNAPLQTEDADEVYRELQSKYSFLYQVRNSIAAMEMEKNKYH